MRKHFRHRMAPACAFCRALTLAAFLLAVASGGAHAETGDLIVIKNAAGEATARLTDDGYWLLAGDLHTEQGTITLDPAKKYWSIKNDVGVPVFAIELEAGDMWVAGEFHEWETDIDDTGDGFTATGPAGTPVFGVDDDTGDATVAGAGLPGWIPPWGTPPMPDDPGEPPHFPVTDVIDRVKAYNNDPGIGEYVLVPEPQAQSRIYSGLKTQSGPPQETWDVSFKQWRKPWVPGGRPERYSLRTGFRYWTKSWIGPGEDSLWYTADTKSTANDGESMLPKGDAIEDDDGVQKDGDGVWSILPLHIDQVHGYQPWKDVSKSGMHDIYMSISDTGNKTSGDYPANSQDGFNHQTDDNMGTAAMTRLWLYEMIFPKSPPFYKQPFHSKHTPVVGSLTPNDIPELLQTKLIFYDGSFSREFVSEAGKAHEITYKDRSDPLKSWDGMLYVNGDPAQGRKFVDKSDVQMKAEVKLGKLDAAEQGYEPDWSELDPYIIETLHAPIYSFEKADGSGTAYGFDNFCGDGRGEPYTQPWVSLPVSGVPGLTPSTTVKLYLPPHGETYWVQLEPSSSLSVNLSGPFPPLLDGEPITITANATSPGDKKIGVKTAHTSSGWPIYGRDLGVAVYQGLIKTVKLVKVYDNRYTIETIPDSSIIAPQSMETFLDDTFKSAVIRFQVDPIIENEAIPYDIDADYDLDHVGDEWGLIEDWLKFLYPDHDVVIAIVKNIDPSNYAGFAIMNSFGIGNQVCYVSTNYASGVVRAQTSFERIIAHEIGHSVGCLKDLTTTIVYTPPAQPIPVQGMFTVDDYNLMATSIN